MSAVAGHPSRQAAPPWGSTKPRNSRTTRAMRSPGTNRCAASLPRLLVAVSDRTKPDDLEQLSAITAGLISLAGTAAQIVDNGAVIQALVTTKRGTLVIMAIDRESSLAVLTTAAADLDMVAYEMTMLVEESGGLFTPPSR